MDTSPFALALIVVAVPIVLLLLAAACLAHRGIGRLRVVDRSGRVLVELVLGRTQDGDGRRNPGSGTLHPPFSPVRRKPLADPGAPS